MFKKNLFLRDRPVIGYILYWGQRITNITNFFLFTVIFICFNHLTDLTSDIFCTEGNKVFDGSLQQSSTNPLDLDGKGGRLFLRVLLHLVMHDYPPLVSGSLALLFRHFSQRQEVLQAFENVSLMYYL